MDPKWYHVCWPRLIAKRVEPVVSINWASCFCSHWSINAAAFFACDNFVGDWLVFSCLIVSLLSEDTGSEYFQWRQLGGGRAGGQPTPEESENGFFFKNKVYQFPCRTSKWCSGAYLLPNTTAVYHMTTTILCLSGCATARPFEYQLQWTNN